MKNSPDKIYCIIDCRVSDKSQLKGDSLELQELAGRVLADKNGWMVDKVFRKPHSATTNERDDIEEALSYIRKRKKEGIKITKYITKSLDRFTRLGDRAYWPLKEKLEAEEIELVDTTGIIQPKRNTLEHLGNYKYSWSVYSPSEAAETFEVNKGKADVRDTLTRLIGAEINLVKEGYAVRRAPDGLMNKSVMVDGKNKIIRENDPKRAKFFQKMFYLLAEGLAETEVIKRLNAIGFRSKEMYRWDRSDKEHPKIIGKIGGKPLTVKHLQQYIRQTEYAGVSYEKWNKHQPIRMKMFDGIVPIDIFNKANKGKIFINVEDDGSIKVLHNYSPWGKVKRLKYNPEFPMKCILCPFCMSEMLGSASTGKSGEKFSGYHCGGRKEGKRNHQYFRISKKEFEQNIRNYLEKLRFDSDFLNGLELVLLNKYREREKEIVGEAQLTGQNVVDLKSKQKQKLDAYTQTDSSIIKKMLEAEIETLDTEIAQAEKVRNEIEITEKEIKLFVRYARYLVEHPAEMLIDTDDLQAQRALLDLVFEEMPTYHQILSGTPKLSFVFNLSSEFKKKENHLVTLRGIEPRLPP